MKKTETYQGIFKGHRLGFGFVKSLNDDFSPDIFIPKNATKQAIEGDLVQIEVTSRASKKGPEGKVTEILERKHTDLGGLVTETTQKSAKVFSPLLGLDKEIEVPLTKGLKLNVGDRIELSLLSSSKSSKILKGQFKKYLGHIKEASCDVDAAISEFVLSKNFPKAVLQEVSKYPKKIIPSQYPNHKDYQDLLCITIDPDTAKDFDDAISLEKSPKGHWVLGVHIADVSYFVPKDSALDQEAFKRCNSTYFPARCLPMLPSELSDNLCSLKPKVPRLAISTFMVLDSEGKLLSYRIERSVIKSRQRFTYKQVKKILDGKEKSPLKKHLLDLQEVALKLKALRIKRGCIDMALDEAVVLVDDQGHPKGIEIVEYDITHQMIEEFMLKTNEVIAKHLSDKGQQIPYRIHEPPKSDNLKEFTQMALTFGYKLSTPPKQEQLQALFQEIKGKEHEHQLSVAFVRCMKLAVYSPENQGHYGLQLDYYCHFTSPIRRYVDLVIHRELFNPASSDPIKEICEKCSDQERLSAKAESRVRLLKILRYLQAENSRKTKTPTYKGLITKVKPFGVFFEIPFLLLEGFVHISKLGDDYYIFKEKSTSIIGQDLGERLEIGQSITLKVQHICLITQEVEWKRSSS